MEVHRSISYTLLFLYLGRQNLENLLHRKQLKIAKKREALWESAVKVAEKAKPMNRHERQLCYTFKYYDKNETKRIDPLKQKKLNGFSSMPGVSCLPEQVNGLADGHESRTHDLSNAETPDSAVKSINGVGHCNNSLKPNQKKNVKEKIQRKRKLSSSAGTSKSSPNNLEASRISEPPKKRKKGTNKQSKELNSFIDSDIVTDKIDIPVKLDLSVGLNDKYNGLCTSTSVTPPRINGDISAFGTNMEVSPNTALKLKIRKITPKQNHEEGKPKRGRPRKPQFVIVSEESESEKEVVAHLQPPNNMDSEQIPDSSKDLTLASGEDSVEEMPKKKRIRKPTSKVLHAKEAALLPSKDSLALKEKKKVDLKNKKVKGVEKVEPKSKKVKQVEGKMELKSKKVKRVEEKVELKSKKVKRVEEKMEPKSKKVKAVEDNIELNSNEVTKMEEKKDDNSVSEPNGVVDIEGSVTSSSDDTGSIKNGVAVKKEKDGVCIVCEQQENLIFCEGICGNAFHLDCIGLSVVPQGKFVCDECVTGNHCCFVCRQTGNVKQCSQPLCTKHYHEECLRAFKATKFDGDKFYCPLHFCGTCVSNKTVVSRGRMTRCVRCPTAYHISGCLVAGCIPLGSNLMVCAKHFLREKNKAHHTHVNVNWCFVCSIGGTLICCESCPAAFHPECISYEGIPEGHFFCKDCTEGKQLLYGDIVWVKLGMYR